MDLITHGLLGAAVAHAAYGRVLPRSAWLIGALAGVAADMDRFLRIPGDPVLELFLQQQFTHALAFIPTGGFLAALPFLCHPAFRGRRNQVLAAAMLAYLTHPLLDAATSVGTALFWPLSGARIALDLISHIDPVFTSVLLLGLVACAVRGGRRPAVVALLAATAYLGAGLLQNQRALATQRHLAEERGHAIVRGRALPTAGHPLVWRSIYLADDGQLHADAIRLLPWRRAQVRTGGSLPHLDLTTIESGDPTTDLTLHRFALYTDGYTAMLPEKRGAIGDMRYTRDPAGFDARRGARIDEHTIVPIRLDDAR
jgi:inner membrane protein